uniref:Uncharacterized protein n=1 Tax=Anopheles minimus TaxID=112268 RepID=A0A182WMV2_9DIPT
MKPWFTSYGSGTRAHTVMHMQKADFKILLAIIDINNQYNVVDMKNKEQRYEIDYMTQFFG